ncbi:MAG: GNAT family N-acetyltransferase [Pirellulales bacterium]|nr:GNAT family N-acetyltransferase [Pirellulales bacterium]
MIRVDEVNDIYELAGYRLHWSSLLPQTPNATFFQSLDWLETYWRHFGGNERLRVLVVSSDARPVGILPLVVRTETTRVGPVRVLTYPLHDWGTFYAPIGPNPTATLTAGLRHIRQSRRDFDLFDLRWVDLDGCDRRRTERAMRRAGFDPRKQAWNRAPQVDLSGDWDEYWDSRSKKWRHNVCRLQRRLDEQGDVRHLRYRPRSAAEGGGDPRWDLYEACLRVAERSWQSSASNGTTLCDASVRDYLRDTHAAAARSGSLDLNLLLLGGRPIAFAYNYHYRGHVCELRKGFDPEFAKLRPGVALTRLMLEDSFQRADRCHDMGSGSLAVKRPWQTSIATSYRYTHFPLFVPRVQLLRMKRWLQDRVYGEESIACAQTA